MTKTATKAAEAFMEGRTVHLGNTRVICDRTTRRMYLFDNLIASHSKTAAVPGVLVTLAGWPTVTTQDRLNALLGKIGSLDTFYRKGGQMHFGREPVRDATRWFRVADPSMQALDKRGLTIEAA